MDNKLRTQQLILQLKLSDKVQKFTSAYPVVRCALAGAELGSIGKKYVQNRLGDMIKDTYNNQQSCHERKLLPRQL